MVDERTVALTGDPNPDPVIMKLADVLDRFEITLAKANDLVILQDFEMVVIADDSSTMNAEAQKKQDDGKKKPKKKKKAKAYPKKKGKPGEPNPDLEDEKRTRWHELQDTVAQIVDIASCFDETGIDIYFLNRPAVLNVKESEDERLLTTFEKKPQGGTPLCETLKKVANKSEGERKVLLFILTDGVPDGGTGRFMTAVRDLVNKGRTKIQLMACTDDTGEIGWMNDLDKGLAGVDVTDDFYAEREEVLAANLVKEFTRGDWVLKAMLGPIDHRFDAWDEALGKKMFPQCCTSCAIM